MKPDGPRPWDGVIRRTTGTSVGGVWEDLGETLERMVLTGGGSSMSTGIAKFLSGTPQSWNGHGRHFPTTAEHPQWGPYLIGAMASKVPGTARE